MAHARTQLREAIVFRLTGLPTSGLRVYGTRVYAIDPNALPAIIVTTDTEEIEPNATGILARALEVNVKCYARATDALDDTLDTMAEEVETAMATGGFPLGAGLSQQITLTTLTVEMNGEGEQPHGVMTLTYRVDYFTATGVPSTPL